MENAARAGVRKTNRFPNGDFRRLRDDATNEVIASSRDHDKLRVENTMQYSATATRGLDRIGIAAGGMIPGPSTGVEVFVPGRQGIRAGRDSNPACGSADLLGTPSIRFLPVVSRQGRVNCSDPGKPRGVEFLREI